VNALTKAIVEATVIGQGTTAIFNHDFFIKRAIVLKKYVDVDQELQLEILYGLQVAITNLDHPPSKSHPYTHDPVTCTFHKPCQVLGLVYT